MLAFMEGKSYTLMILISEADVMSYSLDLVYFIFV